MAERQLARSLDGIRADHRNRYAWAARQLAGGMAADVGCGCGYGSWMLAEADCAVLGIDLDKASIAYARKHWAHENLIFRVQGAADLATPAHAAVMFEVIEHLADPLPALLAARHCTRRLLVSVPNEDVLPFDAKKFPYHQRHYRFQEIEKLLDDAGWRIDSRWGQADKESEVARKAGGRTIVVDCT